MKSMWILGFIGSPEPTELEGLRHRDGRSLPMLPLPPHPAEGRAALGREERGPCKRALGLPLIL